MTIDTAQTAGRWPLNDPEFMGRAQSAITAVNRLMGDQVARDAAKFLAFDRLGDGYRLLIEASVRALIAGAGWEDAADFVAAIGAELEAEFGTPAVDLASHVWFDDGRLDLRQDLHLRYVRAADGRAVLEHAKAEVSR